MVDAPNSPLDIWRLQQPVYERLAKTVQATLNAGLRERGIRCQTTSRAKSLDSFVKKMLRKKYTDISMMDDKAGARVICLYEAHRQIAIDVAKSLFETFAWDDKRATRAATEFGYLGVHCNARLRGAEDALHADMVGISCEIQFHTVAEHAWNAPFHDLIYKPPEGVTIPPTLSRCAYRLLALAEIYDDELTRTREEVLRLPNFEIANLLRYLDEHFYKLTASEYDRDLSFDVLSVILPLYESMAVDKIASLIASFVARHESKLQSIFSEYETADTEDRAFVMQPESIAVFERISVDRYSLENVWNARFEAGYLSTLLIAWGESMA